MEPARRPPQVTYAALAVIVASLVLLVSAFQQISSLHTLDTRTSVERLIGDEPGGLGLGVEDWLRILKIAGMISGACAAAAVILGWQALQRSRAARMVLLVIAAPLVLTGLAVGPLFAVAVAVAVVVLWLPAANAWFEGRPQTRTDAMSEAPPPPDPYGQPGQPGQPGQSGQPTPQPYGQPYGQGPQYGAPYNPYAQQQPYAPYSGAPGAPGVPDRRPGTVTAAAVITIVLSALTAALGLLLALVGSNMAQDMMDELDKRGYDTSDFTAHELAVGFAVMGAVIAVVALAAIVTAIFVLRRSNAARIMLTVMAGLCIAVSLVGIASGGSALTLAGAIAVIVLLYRRSSNAWFATRPGRQQPYPTYPPQPPTWPQG